MPTTTEATGRTTADDDPTNAFDDVYDSLRTGEASGEEAIAETISAITEVLRAAAPLAISQPARFIDLSFELVQQAINLQRRLVFEVLTGFQQIVTESWSDFEGDESLEQHSQNGVEHGSRTARRAA
jgi:hypothetical protein